MEAIQPARASSYDKEVGLVLQGGGALGSYQAGVYEALASSGRLPSDLDEVNERDKDIRYSSRTMVSTNAFRDKHEVRHAINELYKLLPPGLANTEQARRLYEHGCVTEMDIVQLIYRPNEPQGALKDYDFSRATMEARWQQEFPTPAPPCTPRRGSRRCQKSWASACSM